VKNTTIARTARQERMIHIANTADYDITGRGILYVWAVLWSVAFSLCCWGFARSIGSSIAALIVSFAASALLLAPAVPLCSVAVQRTAKRAVRRYRANGDLLDLPGMLIFHWQCVLIYRKISLPNHWTASELSKHFDMFAAVLPLWEMYNDRRANDDSRRLLRRAIRDILHDRAANIGAAQEYRALQDATARELNAAAFNDSVVAMLTGHVALPAAR
jgi:hypothetical protein